MTAQSLTVALIAADPTLRGEALDCLQQLHIHVASDRRDLTDIEDLLDYTERCRIDVLLLEGRLLPAPLDTLTRRLKLTTSEPAVFLLHREAVAENILEAMQAGAREYLCPPLAAPLAESFARLAAVRAEQMAERQARLGKLYGFLSAKGGAGATTFISHVATEFARRASQPALLADLDFEAGLLRFVLKARSRYSARDAVDNLHRMDANYWSALVTPVADRLDFLAAPEELAERVTPEPRQIARLLRFVRATYRNAFVDFGRWYNAAALDSLPELESLYLIITQDMLVLESAQDFIRKAVARGALTHRIRILLNCVQPRLKPDLGALEQNLGVPVAGVFTDDAEALYETWSEGRMLTSESVLGRQLIALAGSLAEPKAELPSAKSKPAGAPALLRRCFTFFKGATA